MNYATADDVLSICTHLVEKDVPFSGRLVRIRELTAQQRQDARQAAFAANPDEANDAIYRAVVVQCGLIDPETKQPLLPPSAVPMLAAGRERPILALASAILQLSEALPGDLFQGSGAADGRQPDTARGAGPAETEAGEPEA